MSRFPGVRRVFRVDERAGWTSGALAGSLVAGLATSGHPVIDRSIPLAAIADAFRLQESGGHIGKIVLEF